MQKEIAMRIHTQRQMKYSMTGRSSLMAPVPCRRSAMTRKGSRNSSLAVIAAVIAIVMLSVGFVALAQVPGADQRSGRLPVAPSPRIASAARGLGPMDAGPLTFLPAVSYASGGTLLSSVTAADLNGDGKLDLVVANYQGFCCTSG